MMNTNLSSAALARTNLGSSTKKILALLLAAVLFLSVGMVGLIASKAAGEYTQLDGTISQVVSYIDNPQYNVYYYDGSNYIECDYATASNQSYKYIGQKGVVTTSNYYYGGRENQNYYVNNKSPVAYGSKNLYYARAIKTTTITVKKIWADGGEHSAETVSFVIKDPSGKELYSGTIPAGRTSVDIEVEGTPETVEETAVTKNGANVLSSYTSTTAKTIETTGTEAGWTKKSYGEVEAGKTYAFTYISNGTTYLLGRNGTSVIGNTSGLSGGVPNSNIGVDYKWKAAKATSGTSYGEWLLQNLGNNYYLAPYYGYSTNYSNSAVLQSSDSYYGNVNLHLDDDGSIWNGYGGLNLYATGATVQSDGSSFTVFTPYLYSEGSYEETTVFTITNTPKETPPASKYTYTLTYNANGGQNPPAQQNSGETEDTSYNFTVSSSKPTRDGYTFKGWASTQALANAGTTDIGNTVTATSEDRNKTIYAVWEKDQEPPTEDPVPTVQKQVVKDSGTDAYTLNLKMTGKTLTSTTPGQTVTTEGKLDLVVVADMSYSMYKKDSSMDDGYGNALYQDEAVRRLLARYGETEGLLYDIIDNNDARIAFVTFSRTATDQGPGWMTSKSAVYSAVSQYQASYGGETNIEDGLTKANLLLQTARSDAKKAILFISDGEPNVYNNGTSVVEASTNYDETAAAKALTQAQITKSLADEAYTIGYAYKETGANFLDTLTTNLGGTQYTAANAQALKQALSTIKESVTTTTSTETHLHEATVTDTLSEYVELSQPNTTNKGVTVSGPNNTTVDPSNYTVTVSNNNKTVTVKFKDSFNMKEGETYTVNIPVKPSESAYTYYKNNAKTYPNTGSANSGATSANKQGFFSNSGTPTLTYTISGDAKTVNFTETPVVQVTVTDFSLKYDKNTTDSVTNMPSPDTDTATENGATTAHTFTISSSKPEREGFLFRGWATDPKATKADYEPGQSIAVSTADTNNTKTLYAVWDTAAQTDLILHKTSHAMFVLSALCVAAAAALFAVEHYRRKRFEE